jgi:hypothetical protein
LQTLPEAIVFGFICHDGTEHNFACPPDAIPVIVARLLGAAQRLATAQSRPTQGIVAKKSEIVVDEVGKTVGLCLFPTEQTGIPFVLHPGHAQKISTDLAHAAAIVDPKKPGTAN